MQDLHNNIQLKNVITPRVVTDDTASVGTIIDRAGYDSLEFLINLGTLSDANATAAVLVEHGDASDLVADGAAVADTMLLGTEAEAGFTFADDGEVRKIGYRGNKRYVRLTITPSGNTGNIPLSAVAILGNPNSAPVIQAAS